MRCGGRMRRFRTNLLLKPGWREGRRTVGLLTTIYLISTCFCPGWEAVSSSQIYANWRILPPQHQSGWGSLHQNHAEIWVEHCSRKKCRFLFLFTLLTMEGRGSAVPKYQSRRIVWRYLPPFAPGQKKFLLPQNLKPLLAKLLPLCWNAGGKSANFRQRKHPQLQQRKTANYGNTGFEVKRTGWCMRRTLLRTLGKGLN